MDDNDQSIEIVKPIAQIVTAVSRGLEEGADAVIGSLDSDQSWENVVQIFASLVTVETSAKHAIGEGLIFLRHRKNFVPIERFKLEEGATSMAADGTYVLYKWPATLLEFIHGRYNVTLSKAEMIEMEEFTRWTAYKYEKFWLLVDYDEVIVWHKTDDKPFDDDSFRDYVSTLSATMSSLSQNSLWSHYVTARNFPRSWMMNHPVNWTTLFEARNVVGSDPEKVDQSLKGEERIRAITRPAQELVEELEQKGELNLKTVRSIQRQNAQKRRGFEFWIPPVLSLHVYDPEGGFNYKLAEFEDDLTARYFHVRAGLLNDPTVDYIEIWFDPEGNLYNEHGHLVGRLLNQNVDTVVNATAHLSNKMRWRPRDTESV